jgi:alpha-glucosidase (family GH31 glycosyl hydrolase)
MKNRRFALLAALLLITPAMAAAEPGVETVGPARFTVVTPQLIRMEYAAGGKFVDAPSWFARNRDVRDASYQAKRDGRSLTIDTGAIRLTYTDDGKPFDAGNLRAEIKRPGGSSQWKVGDVQAGNLGGAIRGLDRVRAAVPMGEGLISRDGWYLYDDSTSVLARGSWWAERPADHGVDWYLFGYGTDYRAALKSLTTVAGDVPLPRKCTLGAWYSRNYRYSQAEFQQIVDEYHANDFPLDTIVMDYGWHQQGWTGWTWNAELIPDPDALMRWFHDHGLTVTVNDHPDGGVQPSEKNYGQFMRDMGQDPASKETAKFDASDQKYMEAWWRDTHDPLMRQGVNFWWLDMGKTNAPGLPSLDGLAMMNDFYFKHTAIDGRRGQSFSRWAGWGDHRDPIHFSGDADSGWPMLAFEVPFTSTSGNAGCFFWSHDTGGYRGGRNEESYARWAQFDALSAALRSHSAGNADMDRRPWKYPAWTTDSLRRSFHLRAELLPYAYTAEATAARTSVPMVRPMYFDHPADEIAYHSGQEYTFGDDLLVAPITTPGQGQNHLGWQHVWFPPGRWYQFTTGERHDGPAHELVAADLTEMPLFARGGVPIAEQPYTERPTSAPLNTLVLRCFPGPDGQTGTASLYEDDGISDGYKHGASATTELSYARHGDEVTVRIAPTRGSYSGQVPSRGYTVLLPATQRGTVQSPADAKLSYDAATGTNRIEVPPAPIGQETIVRVTVADLDPALPRQVARTRRLDGLLGKPLAQWTDAERATAGLSDAVQAVHGVGLMAVNENPFLYGNDVDLVYFAPGEKQPIGGTLAIKSWQQPVKVTPGEPFDFQAAVRAIPPRDTVTVPGVEQRLTFHPAGRPPVTLDTFNVAYNLGNLAMDAHPSVSKGRGENALDGVALGFPTQPDNEWAASGTTKVWIKLTWPKPVEARRVLLYDRPNPNDQVLAGTLTFSDGSKEQVGELPNDGRSPAEVTFAPKHFTWMRFDVTKCSPSTKNAGLAELGVFDR